MKFSLYNLIISDEELPQNKFLLCNTFTGETFLIERKTKEIIENNDLESLDENYVKKFIEAGVIIENDDYDEALIHKYLHEKEKFGSNVLNLTILLTMACNLRCIYCYEAAGIISNASLTDAVRKNIFEFIKMQLSMRGCNHLAIWLFGGEPLLNFESNYLFLDEIQVYCNKNEIEFSTYIVTNGTLLKPSYLEKLKQYNCRYIQITLDGIKEIHDQRRIGINGEGSFDETLRGIHLVTADEDLDNPIIRINIDKSNLDETINLLKFLKEESLDCCSIDFGVVKGDTPSCASYTGNCFLEEELGKVLEPLWKKSLELGFNVSISPMKRNMFCGLFSDSSFTITPSGDVYKCWDFVNIEKHRIGRIGEGGQFTDTTNAYYQWMTRNPYDIEECRSCVYLPACGGGCGGISYSHYGEYNKPGCYKVKSVFEKQIVNKFKGIIDEK